MAGKQYLITGASGFLGINLVRHLLARGHRITGLDLLPFDYPEREHITALEGDVRKREDLARALEASGGCVDVIVHCAAALPRHTPAEIRSTDVEGTRLVLETALQCTQPCRPRVIHISSTAVYGIPKHHPLRETDALVGIGPYGAAKVAAERLCVAYRDKGLWVSVLRPKSFVGPERLGVFSILYAWAQEGRHFPIPGSGRNRFQLLDVEDLCEAIVACADSEASAANDVFNLGAAVYTTLREDFQAVLDAAGYGKRIVSLPTAPAVWLLRSLEKLGLSPIYPWVYETVTEDSFVSLEKAERVLGFHPRFSNRDSLVRNYRWYCSQGQLASQAQGLSHRSPWDPGLLKLGRYFF